MVLIKGGGTFNCNNFHMHQHNHSIYIPPRRGTEDKFNTILAIYDAEDSSSVTNSHRWLIPPVKHVLHFKLILNLFKIKQFDRQNEKKTKEVSTGEDWTIIIKKHSVRDILLNPSNLMILNWHFRTQKKTFVVQ